MVGYTYSNSSDHAAAHHKALADMLDVFTQDRIRDLVPRLRGMQCLEVGAGGGSVARWLAEEVGSEGLVCATDINIRRLPEWPNVVVLEHDIAKGPVPEDGGKGFDLVHARCVLNHVPERRMALHHMVMSLKPGGSLLTQDFMPTRSLDFVLQAPSEEDAALLRRFQFFHLQILREHGNDRAWSQRVARMVEAEGLLGVREVVYNTGEWRGLGPGCRLLLAGLRQVDHELLSAGLNMAEIRRVAALLQDPDVILRGYHVHSVSGHRSQPEAE
jgi:ubiquinone/menaquinone biosynthesis C-methylase UbiE